MSRGTSWALQIACSLLPLLAEGAGFAGASTRSLEHPEEMRQPREQLGFTSPSLGDLGVPPAATSSRAATWAPRLGAGNPLPGCVRAAGPSHTQEWKHPQARWRAAQQPENICCQGDLLFLEAHPMPVPAGQVGAPAWAPQPWRMRMWALVP